MMRVELITHTPEPEKVVATAAKLCYSSSDIASLHNCKLMDVISPRLERALRKKKQRALLKGSYLLVTKALWNTFLLLLA